MLPSTEPGAPSVPSLGGGQGGDHREEIKPDPKPKPKSKKERVKAMGLE